MSNKNIATGAVVILVSIVTVALASETDLTLQGINPAAIIAAIAVVIIGTAWLKRTSKP
jgi:hypothetical protein